MYVLFTMLLNFIGTPNIFVQRFMMFISSLFILTFHDQHGAILGNIYEREMEFY